jgi:dimethylsulfide dehydrogenase subunit beta/complex iron-sulfur molybdoenzyme family reductase subunit beta
MYWNNVETRPGMGYPKQWDQIGGGWKDGQLQPSRQPTLDEYGAPWEFDYEQRLYEGKRKPVMASPDPVSGPNWDEDVGALNGDDNFYFYLPRLCNHCTNPACLAACPRQAIYKREENGIVVLDQERCEGYRYCIAACPYKKIYFNEITGKSEKCIFCYPRLEKGEVNACAAQCPGRLRFVGLLDDTNSAVHKLVHVYKVALPLFPEKGTEPNVFYVPPFNPPKRSDYGKSILEDPRLSLEYLLYLFGPAVRGVIVRLEAELTRAQSSASSELLQLLIGRDAETRYQIRPQLVQIQPRIG